MKAKIIKYLEGRASEKEILGLTSWIEDENNRIKFRKIKRGWKAGLNDQSLPNTTLIELDKFQTRIINEHDERIRNLNFSQRLYKYAAILLFLVSIGGIYQYLSGNFIENATFFNTIFAEKGQISKAMLPDGTMVWLNSGSSLKYSNDFGIRNRDVELIGQGYFEVTKNRNLPFVVSCDEINIRVLGTQFSAESYPNDPDVEVVLEEGSVELFSANSRKAFVHLQPNEIMIYDKKSNHYKIVGVTAKKYTAWRNGIFNIYDQPLNEVAEKLQKRYNQPIEVGDGLKNCKVTFSIRNEDFEDVLKMLLDITHAKAYQEGGIVYLKEK
ncbi:FecR family protein [Sunxiuqinia indica]|uniref:FecR family protein n=1 Tax=Sunxiuqinia indica TaxID=2692584 RepID=UPI00135B5FD2|nr:FecR domain-containing protein [Sunxiuqinia indica]